jgi:hypothetical protein
MKKFLIITCLLWLILFGIYIAQKMGINNFDIADKVEQIFAQKNQGRNLPLVSDNSETTAENDINNGPETRFPDEPLNCSIPKFNQNIKINMPTALSYKSRKEVFN